jgi:hypothetical protein
LNPFVYPKVRHIRRERPGSLSPYSAYKPYLQREFERKCVYCRMPDSMKDYESYGVDHYRPKSLFENLLTTYSNLFYSCNPCNRRKGDYWPPRGKGKTHYVPNPCDHKMFEHLRFKGATIQTTSQPGAVAEKLMDLNDPEAVDFRKLILDMIVTYESKRVELKKALLQIRAKRTEGTVTADAADQAIAKLDARLVEVNGYLDRLVGR